MQLCHEELLLALDNSLQKYNLCSVNVHFVKDVLEMEIFLLYSEPITETSSIQIIISTNQNTDTCHISAP